MPYLFNANYLCFMLPAFLLTMLAQLYVSSAYKKWSKVPAGSGLTGAQAANRLINNGGLYSVRVEGVAGNLTDHYDPRTKVLSLSQGVYQSNSVASLAVAAHELGHAVQDQEAYLPLRLRAALVPAANIGSMLGWVLIFIGMILRLTELAWVGVAVFSIGAIFALATIPVELNASARAKRLLADSGMIVGEAEQRGVNNVLNAAALTYVAALLAAIMQLFYFISMVGGGGRRR
jgi:Zn-dependent membrane protease YugP